MWRLTGILADDVQPLDDGRGDWACDETESDFSPQRMGTTRGWGRLKVQILIRSSAGSFEN
jgi:hypothetical protein